MSNFSTAVLRIKNFRLLIICRMLGVLALQSQAVIVGWQIYSLTKSPFLLGLTGLVEAVPAIACALFAGHIVDISTPKKAFLGSIGTLTLNTFLLLLIAGGHIAVPMPHLLYLIYTFIFISGIARSFIMPASFSMLPQIVSRPQIPAATAWQSSAFQIAATIGPAIVGFIYAVYGPPGAWLMPSSLLALCFVLLNFINIPETKRMEERREPAMKSIKAGWSFILQNPVLLSVMVLDMFAVLFGGAVAMLPAYADQILHVGAEGLGALRAAPAAGGIIVALALALKPMKKLSAVRMLWVVTGFGLCIICFGFSKLFWFSMLCLVLSGAFDGVSVVIRSTLMQLLTPEHMRGRVSSVNSMFIISSNEIGGFESGTMARLLGLVPSVVMGGFATLVVVAVTALLSPRFRKTVVDTEHQS